MMGFGNYHRHLLELDILDETAVNNIVLRQKWAD